MARSGSVWIIVRWMLCRNSMHIQCRGWRTAYRLGSARFYSTLDLTKGYWQIPLTPISKEKTAFTTLFGLHQFVTLPFGLFGAPATFSGSWTGYSDLTLHMPLPIWMILSSTVTTGSVICSICGLFWDRWEGPDSWPTWSSVRLDMWRSVIWASTWVTDRCVPKLIRRQQLQPVRGPRPKRRWGSSSGWRDII